MGPVETRALVRSLLNHGEQVPPVLYVDILARGAEAVAPLVEVLEDASLDLASAPGLGFGPTHAAELLARLALPEVIEPLVRRLLGARLGSLLHDTLLYALEELGPPVVPVALEALEGAWLPDQHLSLLSVLAHAGVKDERIYTLLLRQLREDVVQGALSLGRYGDPRALEHLLRELDALPVDDGGLDLFANQALVELESAIYKLGGTLDVARRQKVMLARRSRVWLNTMFRRLLEMVVEFEKREARPHHYRRRGPLPT